MANSGLAFASGLAQGASSALDRYLQRKFIREQQAEAERRQKEAETRQQEFQRELFEKGQEALINTEKRAAQRVKDETRERRVEEYGPAGVAISPLAPGEEGAVATETGLMESIRSSPKFALEQAKAKAQSDEAIAAYGRMTPEYLKRIEAERAIPQAQAPPHPWELIKYKADAVAQAANIVSNMVQYQDPKQLQAVMDQYGVNNPAGLIGKMAAEFSAQMGIPELASPNEGLTTELNRLKSMMDNSSDPAEAASLIGQYYMLAQVPEKQKAEISKAFKAKFGTDLVLGAGPEPIQQEATERLQSAQEAQVQSKVTELEARLDEIQAALSEPAPVVRASKLAALGYNTDDDARTAHDTLSEELTNNQARLAGMKLARETMEAGRALGRAAMGAASSTSGFIAGVTGSPEAKLFAGLGSIPTTPPLALAQGIPRLLYGGAKKKPGPEPAMAAAEPGFGQPRRNPAPEPEAATAPVAAAAKARSTGRKPTTSPKPGAVKVGGTKIDRGLAERERYYLGVARYYYEQGTVPPPDIEQGLRQTQYLIKLAGGTPLELNDVETIVPQRQGTQSGYVF